MLADHALRDKFVWLDPPALLGTKHVVDVYKAISFEDHQIEVRAWGESVWRAWKQKYYDAILTLVSDVHI